MIADLTNTIRELKDVRPPLAWPYGISIWLVLLIILAVGLLLLIGWYLKKRARSQDVQVPAPHPDPWQVASQRLRELRQQDLPGQGLIKEYYIRLSAIVREYIELRFLIRAPEMTTEEFLDSLKGSAILNQTQKQALNEFLTCCDMVKFARYSSNPSEMDKSFVLAEKLIEETRPADSPAGSAHS